MSRTTATLFALLVSVSGFAQTTTFHDYKAKTISGDMLEFSTLRGKKVMVVNTASFCSWTPQYEDLQDLYEQYQDSNFVIIGFPCNDFNSQEPQDDSTINEFCTGVYGITFQMMSKVAAISHDTHQVYKWLQRADLNGVADAHVSWNFNKFLIDEAGHWVAHYSNLVDPYDARITNWIESPSVLPPDTIDTTATALMDVSFVKLAVPGIAGGDMNIAFSQSQNRMTKVSIHSVSGQWLSTVYRGIPQAGEVIHVDAAALANGMYFLRVRNEDESKTFRFVVVK